MRRRFLLTALVALLIWGLATVAAGMWLLPPMLLGVQGPQRNEGDRAEVRARLGRSGASWERSETTGGEGQVLEVWRLRRTGLLGVVIYLHGFGDDAWGTLGRAAELPGWDAVGFTFRGKGKAPCTLGAWERKDVVAVVHRLELEGIPRQRIVLAGWSMGAGVGLLALEELEAVGGPLGGALLECPFEDIRAATRDHIRGTLGDFEILVRPAEELALHRVGKLAQFDPEAVSPRQAARSLRTPVAFVTGDADRETPVAGVRAIAATHPDLTVVPGAGHCEASNRLPGGWGAWAGERLRRWGLAVPPQ